MKKLVLFLIIAFLFSINSIFASYGPLPASKYGISEEKEIKINKTLNKISVKIIANWWKEWYLYKNLDAKIDELISSSTDEKKTNILKYIDDYLDKSVEIEWIIKVWENKDYDKILEWFIENMMSNPFSFGAIDRKKDDVNLINENKEVFIDLFKQNKLPIFYKFEVWGTKFL